MQTNNNKKMLLTNRKELLNDGVGVPRPESVKLLATMTPESVSFNNSKMK
jgi:hypothetical protein